jgi:hypothetical protein
LIALIKASTSLERRLPLIPEIAPGMTVDDESVTVDENVNDVGKMMAGRVAVLPVRGRPGSDTEG